MKIIRLKQEVTAQLKKWKERLTQEPAIFTTKRNKDIMNLKTS